MTDLRPLPDLPFFEDLDFDPAGIADDQTRRFVETMRRDGGAVLDLGDEAKALCDQAVAETDGYFARRRLDRVQDAWRRSPAVRRLATLPEIHQRLFAAFGRRSFPFQTLNFQTGSQQHLHTDIVHFSSVPERFMCGVWIALEDVEPGSGPVLYYPGSHRLETLTMRAAGVNSAIPGPEDYGRHFVPRFGERIDATGLAPSELYIPKGSAFVWAANLAHGGAPITRAGSTRRSLVVHCYFEDTVYFTPLASDEEAGRLRMRIPPDIQRGRWRWPRRNGKRVRVDRRTIVNAVIRALLNRPHLS